MAHDNGLKNVLARLEATKIAAKEAAMRRLIRGAHKIAKTQRELVPVDSGDLRDSITVTEPGQTTPPYSQPGGSRTAGEDEVLITAGNSGTRYPHHPEYGTVKMAAQPYFWPGYYMEIDKELRGVGAVFRQAARKEWDK